VTVDGKPLALDASGQGAYAIDVSADLEGSNDTKATLSRKIGYVVTPKGGAAETGNVVAQAPVMPLHVDAPGLHAVVDTPSVTIAGRAPPGAQVSINGKAQALDADGFFADTVVSSAPGAVAVEVSAAEPHVAPRMVHLSVKRVQSLDTEAKALEAAGSPGYDALMANVAGSTGAPVVIDGEIISALVRHHVTNVVATDTRGCARSPCVAHVVITHEETLSPGDAIKAYGRVIGSTVVQGKNVPDVEADFILKGGKRR
jgi:hypothetical protein